MAMIKNVSKQKKKKKKLSRLTYNLIITVLFLFGIIVLMYPTFSDMLNRYVNSLLIVDYSDAVNNLTEKDYSQIMAEAKAYNDQHTINLFVDVFENEDYVLSHPYDTLLNPLGDETMGYISIPKINVKLAIGHGTGVVTLEKGVGHIEGTSLPIGGPSTHSVLSAHRGLPSAKLFTDLDEIVVEDKFFIYVLNEVLAYEVDQINVIEPDELDKLAIIPGEDLVTLLTCTPYGVNSHRLIVRGHRIPYVPEDERPNMWHISERDLPIILLCVGILLFLIIFLVMEYIKYRDNKKKRKEEINDKENTAKSNS